jgi:hypothetical protein
MLLQGRSLPAMLATNWTAVGGIAQLCAAGATVVLAIFTAVMAKRTHAVAKETHIEAGATATLVNETRIDRQLQWQPQMELSRFEVLENAGPAIPTFTFKVSVRNNGAGPALQARVAVRTNESSMSNWALVSLGDVRPGDTAKVEELSVAGGPMSQPFEEPKNFEPREVNPTIRDFVCAAVFCSDVLGRRYRFLYTSLGDAVGAVGTSRLLPAEIVEVDEKVPPRWTLFIS